jgi:hypothetical protein
VLATSRQLSIFSVSEMEESRVEVHDVDGRGPLLFKLNHKVEDVRPNLLLLQELRESQKFDKIIFNLHQKYAIGSIYGIYRICNYKSRVKSSFLIIMLASATEREELIQREYIKLSGSEYRIFNYDMVTLQVIPIKHAHGPASKMLTGLERSPLNTYSYYLQMQLALFKTFPGHTNLIGASLALNNGYHSSRNFMFLSFDEQSRADEFGEEINSRWQGARKLVDATSQLVIVSKVDLEKCCPLKIGSRYVLTEEISRCNWLDVEEN